jgi:hypothetical protein
MHLNQLGYRHQSAPPSVFASVIIWLKLWGAQHRMPIVSDSSAFGLLSRGPAKLGVRGMGANGRLPVCIGALLAGKRTWRLCSLTGSLITIYYGSGAYQNGSLRIDPADERRLRPFHCRLDDLALG